MSLKRRLALTTVIQIIGKAFGVLVSLATVRLITRHIGVEGYGEYTSVIAYCSLYAVFADLGVNLNLTKELSRGDGDETDTIGTAVSLRFISSISVLLVAFFISFLLPYSATAHQGIAIILLAIFAQTANSLFVSILQAKLHMQYATATEFLGRIVIFGCTSYVFSKGYGFAGVFWAVTIGNFVNLCASYVLTKRLTSIRAKWDVVLWKQVLVRSLPISATAILSLVYFKVDSVILSNIPIIGHSNVHEIGIYGTAYKVLEILLVLPAIFMGNIFPVISNFIAKKDSRLPQLLQQSFDVLYMVGAFVTVLVFILAPQIITFISDARFAPAAIPLRILSFAVLTSYFSGIFTYALRDRVP